MGGPDEAAGARTPIVGLKDQSVYLLSYGKNLRGDSKDTGKLAGTEGFEPPVTEPKSAALPLGYVPTYPSIL